LHSLIVAHLRGIVSKRLQLGPVGKMSSIIHAVGKQPPVAFLGHGFFDPRSFFQVHCIVFHIDLKDACSTAKKVRIKRNKRLSLALTVWGREGRGGQQ
jgi:hypothetical protein